MYEGVWQIDKAGNITRFYPTPEVGEVIECPAWIKALLLEQHPYMFPQEYEERSTKIRSKEFEDSPENAAIDKT